MQFYRLGTCNHCGACCMLRLPDGEEQLCPFYTTKNPNGKCSLFGTKKRPKECHDFPRNPMDLERVQKWCKFKFVDEKGNIVDSYMDKRIQLVPLKNS